MDCEEKNGIAFCLCPKVRFKIDISAEFRPNIDFRLILIKILFFGQILAQLSFSVKFFDRKFYFG